MPLTIIIFLIILSVLVLIHELGHFIVAKLLKIKVEEFGFGLPPRAFGIKRGETVYSINWLPIGGFVKLYGEDEAGSGRPQVKSQKLKVKNLDRTFFARPVWQRALVVAAGVFMNFALAVVIISYLFSVVGVPVPGDKVSVSEIVKGSPAEISGLKPGDTIESINSIKITSSSQLISYTKEHLGEKLTLKIRNQKSEIKSIEVTPRKEYPVNQGPMGVAISQSYSIVKYPWYKAPFVGTWEALKQSYAIVLGLGSLVVNLFTKGAVPQGVAGPVGIAQLTGIFCSNINSCLSFAGMLSLNLAILNVLPIPALDGGRLFFIIIEAVTRRKVNQKVEGYAHAVGMAVLLGLIALITLHDLIRVFTGQPILPK
ncbi:MAG: M50 family metallopeptidase [Patescibacteria group bacterium]|nr:M50 family metallopeptidase [Patescibacteria group bacterium]